MEKIYRVGGRLDLVVTLKDDLARKRAGRVYVDDVCRTHGIDLVKIRHNDDPDALAVLREAALDWLFIIGWSQIASREVLQLLRQGALGMHPTLLPKGRARAPQLPRVKSPYVHPGLGVPGRLVCAGDARRLGPHGAPARLGAAAGRLRRLSRRVRARLSGGPAALAAFGSRP